MPKTLEHRAISVHEYRLVCVLRSSPETWYSNLDLADLAKVSDRTARAHTLRLVKLGMLDQMDLFPGHRYRWSEKSSARNKAYLNRLDRAAQVFGIPS